MIHDRYYSTPPASFRELRWRLQHIAEEEVGKRARQTVINENAVAAHINDVAGG